MISHQAPEQSVRLQSFSVSATALALALVACGGAVTNTAQSDGGSTGDDSGGVAIDSGANTLQDSGSTVHDAAREAAPIDTGIDTGGPSSVYPAFPIDAPQVQDNGGPTLAAPVIVTITWSTDPDANTYNTFGDTIGASSYWHALNTEYSVGPATSGTTNHVTITTAPAATMADSDLDTLVATNAGVAPWPASTPNTIYAVYMPPGMGLTFGGQDVCQQGIGGYHSETSGNVVYAIMPHCNGFMTQDVELSASHELDEAVTDPHTNSNPAYIYFDQNHLAMEFFNSFQSEIGDACEMMMANADPIDFPPYVVQRQWSNKAAAAGHDWCVPSADGYMYNTTLLPSSNEDAISVDLSSLGLGVGVVPSKGFKVALNQTRTFPIGLFSDKALSGPFTIDVQGLGQPIGQDQQGNPINNGTATVTLDRTSGVNGEIANVTVTPTAYSSVGVVFFYIRSVLPGSQQHHYLPILISQN